MGRWDGPAPVCEKHGKTRCASCYQVAYYRSMSVERKRKRMLWVKYRLRPADFDAMWDAQGGRCAICREILVVAGDLHSICHIDHDHTTGRVRGLLCPRCNKGIGFFGDDSELMEAAARYLRVADDHA